MEIGTIEVKVLSGENVEGRKGRWKCKVTGKERRKSFSFLSRVYAAYGRAPGCQTMLLRDQGSTPRPSTYLQCKQIKESSTDPVYDHLPLQYTR